MSHVNTDFDALASILAAKKLYPDAISVIANNQETKVKQFLNIYRDTLQLTSESEIDWTQVSEVILVDVASLQRIGNAGRHLSESNVSFIVYDHHPQPKDHVPATSGKIEQVGATITLLIESLQARKIPISEFEATILIVLSSHRLVQFYR